ncbi:MAG: hypothetical protein DWQ31_14075 [Planctomycetota bacterium]|nr:MAG: hypothetical protein DWQ31_14075 [Planctomycetota bacterium]REJ94596.1 MAG: hypothetical protein DWQ35_07655 [Planctomycetota bacterium]
MPFFFLGMSRSSTWEDGRHLGPFSKRTLSRHPTRRGAATSQRTIYDCSMAARKASSVSNPKRAAKPILADPRAWRRGAVRSLRVAVSPLPHERHDCHMNDTTGRRLLLVGWDSATWDLLDRLLDEGKLPHLQSLVERGAIGTMRTRGPLIDPAVYNSIATGKHADKHGVVGNVQAGTDGSFGPVSSATRRCKAFWEALSESGQRCQVVNFPAAFPADSIEGAVVAREFFPNIQRRPRRPGAGAVHPDSLLENVQEFIVALEEIGPDVMGTFVPNFRQLRASDPRLVRIGLATSHDLSVHAVATWLLENREWDLLSVNYRLLEFLCSPFLRHHLPATDLSATDETDDVDRGLFGGVVSQAAILCDRFLGRLMELAGDEVSVIVYSPRGQLPPRNRHEETMLTADALPPTRYRGDGIFAIRAAGVPEDELIHEVTFLDVCPTVLRLCGLPTGRDMDGRPIQDMFAAAGAATAAIDSWDDRPPQRRATRDPADTISNPLAMHLEDQIPQKDIRRIEAGNLWDLSHSQLAANRREAALPRMVRLYHASPLDVERGPQLAEALYLAGFSEHSRDVMAPLAKTFPDTPMGKFMAGIMAMMRQDYPPALDLLRQVLADEPRFPRLLFYVGHLNLLMDQWDAAVSAYQKAIELDPVYQRSYLGLSEALLQLGHVDQAIDAALSAVGCDFMQPAGHVALGRALSRIDETSRAREAFENALRLDAENSNALHQLKLLDQFEGAADAGMSDEARARLTPPLYPRLQEKAFPPTVIEDALAETTAWRNAYAEDLEAAERALDDYLDKFGRIVPASSGEAEAASPEATKTAAEVREADDRRYERLRSEHWILRPIEPADQPTVRAMFNYPFHNPAYSEILVTHPAGSKTVHGGVLLQPERPDCQSVRLLLSMGTTESGDQPPSEVMMWLIRAGLARAAAGGAGKVIVSLADEVGDAHAASLNALGLRHQRVHKKHRMLADQARDRCLRIFNRLKKHGKVPDDARIESLETVPWEQADAFLKKFFVRPFETFDEDFTPHLSCMIFTGGEIVAGGIHARVDDETVLCACVAVDERFQGSWVSPMLFGYHAKYFCEDGLKYITYYYDENERPESAQFATRCGQELIETVHEYAIELEEPLVLPDRD